MTKAKDKKETETAAPEGAPVPKSSLTSAVTGGNDVATGTADENSLEARMIKAGLGLIKVDGVSFNYVGIAPALDKDAETDAGIKITPMNSVFRSLTEILFHNSVRIKDPATGEFYYPADGVTSWEGCELGGKYLVPQG